MCNLCFSFMYYALLDFQHPSTYTSFLITLAENENSIEQILLLDREKIMITTYVYIHFFFFFLSKVIILWTELPWPENLVNTCVRHTETLDSYFDLIRPHQQCIPLSPPLEIKPVTIECRAKTLPLSHSPHHTQVMPN